MSRKRLIFDFLYNVIKLANTDRTYQYLGAASSTRSKAGLAKIAQSLEILLPDPSYGISIPSVAIKVRNLSLRFIGMLILAGGATILLAQCILAVLNLTWPSTNTQKVAEPSYFWHIPLITFRSESPQIAVNFLISAFGATLRNSARSNVIPLLVVKIITGSSLLPYLLPASTGGYGLPNLLSDPAPSTAIS